MSGRVMIDMTAFRKMWTKGDSVASIAAALGISETTVDRRVHDMGLPRRGHGGSRRLPPVAQPRQPAPDAVAAPPDAVAMFRRLGGGERAVSVVATRYGLPYGVVRGLA